MPAAMAAWLPAVAVVVLSVDHLPEPLGLETTAPHFSWKARQASTAAAPRGIEQTHYRLQIAETKTAAAGPYVWDSGSVASNSSSAEYTGSAALLAPDRPFFARVLVSYGSHEHEESSPVPVASASARFSVSHRRDTAQFIGLSSSTPPPAPTPPPTPGPGPAAPLPFNQSSCPWLRKRFSVSKDFDPSAGDSALIAVGSVGFHELWINGKKATDDVLSPSISNLAKRVLVRTYDVAPLLLAGKENVVGLWLSTGWAGFNSVNPAKTNMFNVSHAPLAMAELTITYSHAKTPPLKLRTDGTWKASPSDTAHLGAWKNGNFGGDRVDARLSQSQPSWASAAVDDTTWSTAVVHALPNGIELASETLEPNRLREAVGAKAVMSHGKYIEVEMEQVFTGWVTITGMRGKPGSTVRIMASSIPFTGSDACDTAHAAGRPYCAGTLPTEQDPDGTPQYTMQHEYVFNSSGVGDFSPRFSYHEVHFLVITGLTETPTTAQITGYRVGNIAHLFEEDEEDGNAAAATATAAATGVAREQGSDAGRGSGDGGGRARLSHFSCSDSTLNAIYNTSLWTKANLVTGGMSVDCPHRERLGYIGDAHTSLETSLQNFNSVPFYTKWAADIGDIQGYPAHTGCGYGQCKLPQGLGDPEGYIAHTAPTIDGGGGPGWSGFICVMPWELYLTSGDIRPLRDAFPHQVKLLRFWNRARSASDGLIHDWSTVDRWAFLGDWISPHGSEPSTSPEALLFNNCYILYCTRIVANASLALGNTTAAAIFEADATKLAAAIHKHFFQAETNGYLDTRQTHLVMPLVAGAVPAEHQAGVWAALRKEILETQAGHFDTGLHGTYFMVKLLTDTSFGFGGGDDLLYAMTVQKSYPGYVDLLTKGFTTWPEDWGTAKPHTGTTDSSLRQPYLDATNWTSGSDSPVHGTLNGIGLWFIAGLGGIRRAPGRVGYQHFELRPPWGSTPLTHAQASYDSTYGIIRSEWSATLLHSKAQPIRGPIHVTYNVTVPINARATVYVPAESKASVNEVGAMFGVRFLRMANSTGTPSVPLALFEVGSGSYSFSSQYQG